MRRERRREGKERRRKGKTGRKREQKRGEERERKKRRGEHRKYREKNRELECKLILARKKYGLQYNKAISVNLCIWISFSS
jgi:hypothetical protein